MRFTKYLDIYEGFFNPKSTVKSFAGLKGGHVPGGSPFEKAVEQDVAKMAAIKKRRIAAAVGGTAIVSALAALRLRKSKAKTPEEKASIQRQIDAKRKQNEGLDEIDTSLALGLKNHQDINKMKQEQQKQASADNRKNAIKSRIASLQQQIVSLRQQLGDIE